MNIDRIKNLREDSDMTQTELAEILHTSVRSYCHYEKGTRKIPLDILVALADHYNCSVDYLLGRTNNKKMNK